MPTGARSGMNVIDVTKSIPVWLEACSKEDDSCLGLETWSKAHNFGGHRP